jgi:hypothetical protein
MGETVAQGLADYWLSSTRRKDEILQRLPGRNRRLQKLLECSQRPGRASWPWDENDDRPPVGGDET